MQHDKTPLCSFNTIVVIVFAIKTVVFKVIRVRADRQAQKHDCTTFFLLSGWRTRLQCSFAGRIYLSCCFTEYVSHFAFVIGPSHTPHLRQQNKTPSYLHPTPKSSKTEKMKSRVKNTVRARWPSSSNVCTAQRPTPCYRNRIGRSSRVRFGTEISKRRAGPGSALRERR